MSASKVVLTKEEAEMARVLFPRLSLQQALETYARNKRLLVTEGRIAPRPGQRGPKDGRYGDQ
jgi:hypothetical protein